MIAWPRSARASASLLAALVLAAVARPVAAAPAAPVQHTAPAPRAATHPAPATVPIPELAAQIRAIEEIGGWARAAELMRQLRGRVPLDPDLELMLAWCEARSGQLDSAATRLAQPILVAAGDDSMPAVRWTLYTWKHEGTWFGHRFEGWHWYVWRTRTEVAAAQGRWDDALASARRAVAARPRSGSEWYLRALCAAHDGLWDEARSCGQEALELDPTLPESHYLAGLLAWREGRRNEAHARFRTAMTLDSGYAAPAIAQMKLRLPAATPDTLPGELLNGPRRAGLLTAPDLPKREVFIQDSSPASMTHPVWTADVDTSGVPDRAHPRAQLQIAVLVGADGRAALVDVPPYSPADVSIEKVSRIVATLPEWRFRPATRMGRPVAAWAGLEFWVIP
jgi:tetratricopeptide (TPR) repeat protein